MIWQGCLIIGHGDHRRHYSPRDHHNHQPLIDRMAQQHGETGKEKADIVDAQHLERDKFPQNRPVSL